MVAHKYSVSRVAISRRGMCFWCGRSCMHNKVWKVWEGGQSVHWKGSRTWAWFWNAQITRIWSFLKTATHFICFASRCCSLLHSLLSTRTSWCCGCIYALCLLFRFRSRLLALSSSLTSQFLPFWSCNNETTSAATALRTINLHKCTHLIALPSRMDVCTQATPLIAFLKQDGSWAHTPLTKNMLCKISSLMLRRSAKIPSNTP